MRDPHVEWLQYDLVFGDDVELLDPPPADFNTPLGRIHMEAGTATIYPANHYPAAATAREAVEPMLRAWEIDRALANNGPVMTFQYRNGELVDRNPLPPPAPGEAIKASFNIQLGDVMVNFKGQVKWPVVEYPRPPETFQYTPDVETLWNRYQGYLKGREPLLSMAYFCLTILESQAPDGKGKRRSRAAAHYQIDDAVLDKLGELTARRGGPDTARKAGLWPSLTQTEEKWIEHAIRTVIRRVGEQAPDRTLDQITMADLPEA